MPAVPSPDTTAWSLHLDEAIAMARARNWDDRSAAHDLAVAEAGIRIAREHPNPSFSWLTGHVHAAGGDATPLGNDFWSRGYDSVSQLAQLFELGGKRGDRRRVAAAGADAARARLADVRRVVEEDVVRAYVGAALAEAGARIAAESAGYLRDEAGIAEVRLNAGDISRSDLDQIRIAADRLELDARAAQSAATGQRIALEILLGRAAPRGSLIVADSLDDLADRALAAPAAMPGPGLRPDVAAARADARRAALALALERAQRIPDATLIFQYEHAPPDRPDTYGLGVSFPLPIWNRNGAAITAARVEVENAKLTAARTEAAAVADTSSIAAAREEASGRWQRYRDALRPRSEDIRRTVSLAYQRGGASLLDLLAAQRSDNDVRLATMEAAADAAIAAAEWRAATTTFIPEASRP